MTESDSGALPERSGCGEDLPHSLHAGSGESATSTAEQFARLVEQLRVGQAELEMQNDALRRLQHELEASRDRYADLYDGSPVGYITLDGQGCIRELNHTSALLLGREARELVGWPLVEHIALADREEFLAHVGRCFGSRQRLVCEVALDAAGHRTTVVQLCSIPLVESTDGQVRVRMVVTDITERKGVEAQLKALAETLEQRISERTALADERAEQLRDMASQLTQAEHRERRRLAQILHDSLQQQLVAIQFKLAEIFRRPQDPGVLAALQEIENLLNESIDASRGLAYELSPPILHDSGLCAALEWLARWNQEKHGLVVDVLADKDAEPGEESARVLLFEIVRELLFNVVKHGQTLRARVELSRGPDHVQVVVCDDGVGFEPTRFEPPVMSTHGFGLSSIRERLNLMGGMLKIDSAPGCGTRITVRVGCQQPGGSGSAG